MSTAKRSARNAGQFEVVKLETDQPTQEKTRPTTTPNKLSLEAQMAAAAGVTDEEINLGEPEHADAIVSEVDMPQPPESAAKKRLVDDLTSLLENNATAIVGNGKKTPQSQLAMLNDFVRIDRSNPSVRQKGAVPEAVTVKYGIDARKLLQSLGEQAQKARSIEQLSQIAQQELNKLQQKIQKITTLSENMPLEASALLEKQGLLMAVTTLLGQKKEMLPDTLAIIQAETQRTNEKHAQQLEQERAAQQKEYREKSAAIFSAIEKELTLFLQEMTDERKVLRHGATTPMKHIADTRSFFKRIVDKITSSSKKTEAADTTDTYTPPFNSKDDFLNAVGLNEREKARIVDFNGLYTVLENTYQANERQISKYTEDTKQINTLEDLRTGFVSPEIKKLIATREGIARALALVDGKGKATFERREKKTVLYHRTKKFTELQGKITKALTHLQRAIAA